MYIIKVKDNKTKKITYHTTKLAPTFEGNIYNDDFWNWACRRGYATKGLAVHNMNLMKYERNNPDEEYNVISVSYIDGKVHASKVY